MISKFTAVLFLCVCLPAQAQLFVGNGGEGWVINDRLIVRDLAENGMVEDRDLYFGTEANQDLQSKVESLNLGDLAFSHELLLRKLTDLNSMYPGLGNYVALAMESYAWSLTDKALKLIPGDVPVVEIELSARVQIANRFQTHIRIHRASWNKLSDRNKIALLIHEGIYSLLTPECEGRICGQPAHKARAIVAQAFTAPGLRIRNMEETIAGALGLPKFPPRCPLERKPEVIFGVWRNDLWLNGTGDGNFKIAESKVEGELLSDSNLRDLQAEIFCTQNSAHFTKRKFILSAVMSRSSVRISRNVYATGLGAGENQLWIQGRSLVSYGMKLMNPANREECQRQLRWALQDWFDYGLKEFVYAGQTCDKPEVVF